MFLLVSLLLCSDLTSSDAGTPWIDRSSYRMPRIKKRDFWRSTLKGYSSPDVLKNNPHLPSIHINSSCASLPEETTLSNSCIMCDSDGFVIPVSRVINECSLKWKDSWTKSKCELPENDELYTFLPAQASNGLVYRNLYCALCNYVDLKYTIIWKINTKCSTSCLSNYLKKDTLKSVIARLLSFCTITLIPPSKSRRNKILPPLNFKHCDESTTSVLQSDLDFVYNNSYCIGYSSYIEMSVFRNPYSVYKRWHCCHGDNENGSKCIITGPHLCSNSEDSPISLEYTGEALIMTLGGKAFVEKLKTCPPSAIYEPLKQKCVPMFATEPHSNETIASSSGNKSIIAVRIISGTGNAFAKSSGISINVTEKKTSITIYNSTLTGKGAIFLSLFTVIGSSLSLVGLAFSFITYSLFSDLRSMAGTTMMNLFAALFLAQLLFLMGMDSIGNKNLCTAIAIGLHFTWLTAFFWMNVMAYDLYKTLDSGLLGPGCRTMKKMFIFYTLYAWGIPAIIVATCALVRFGTHETFTYIGGPKCFILERNAIIYAFAIPTALVTLLNVYIFIRTFFAIKYMAAYTRPYKKHRKSRPETIQLILYIRVYSLMVINWIFGFLSNFTDLMVFWYIFTVLNTLQGLLISLSFTCNTRVFKFYAKRRKNKPGDISSYGASELSHMSQATSLTMLRWDPTPEIL